MTFQRDPIPLIDFMYALIPNSKSESAKSLSFLSRKERKRSNHHTYIRWFLLNEKFRRNDELLFVVFRPAIIHFQSLTFQMSGIPLMIYQIVPNSRIFLFYFFCSDFPVFKRSFRLHNSEQRTPKWMLIINADRPFWNFENLFKAEKRQVYFMPHDTMSKRQLESEVFGVS